jgi:hypothetical protein
MLDLMQTVDICVVTNTDEAVSSVNQPDTKSAMREREGRRSEWRIIEARGLQL